MGVTRLKLEMIVRDINSIDPGQDYALTSNRLGVGLVSYGEVVGTLLSGPPLEFLDRLQTFRNGLLRGKDIGTRETPKKRTTGRTRRPKVKGTRP